jgi:hypothetical protein
LLVLLFVLVEGDISAVFLAELPAKEELENMDKPSVCGNYPIG